MSESQSEAPAFGKIRSFLWPIHGYELRKFLPMGFMMFFILFNYTILRNSKDALVVSAGGASVIPFLKGYIVFPASILFVLIYSKLVDTLKKEHVFYSVVSFFLIFYTLFAAVIYPNKEILHPSPEMIAGLKESFPALVHFISIFETWSFSLYYVCAELWGSSIVSLLFWQFANEITKTSEAKRFYAMFSLIANFSLIFAGGAGKSFSNISKSLAGEGQDIWGYSINMIVASVVLAGLAIMFLYHWICKNVLTDPRFYDANQVKKSKKKKAKMSASDGFKFLFTNKYLGMIALLVLCYGISMNLVELLWKNQLKLAFPHPNDYNNFMGNLSIGTGIFTIITIILSKGIVEKFGWFLGAVITPVMILVTGCLFFACIFFSGLMEPVSAMFGMSSLIMGVWIGTIQNILSKGVKYSLFDPTKEMAYIPLDEQSKTKGKAAVDVIGARLGKASGGYISSGLLIVTAGTVSDIAPYLSIFIVGVICVWIFAVKNLGSMYAAKLEEQKEEA